MIEYLSVAEFHETEGAKVILTYPNNFENNDIHLASYILSEGLHKFDDDSNIAIFRRKIQFENPEDHPK